MADMLTPLNWETPSRARRGAADLPPAAEQPGNGSKEKGSREAFMWPTPPYAGYPAPTEQTETLPCQIVTGAECRVTSGRLTFFVPETGVAHLQVPPARTTVPLRFDQFKSLTLTTPLQPLPLPLSDSHAELLSQRQASPYKVTLAQGGAIEGQTVGHVETDFGLFLFPPCSTDHGDGSVNRMFVPKNAYSSFEIGRRIGAVLIAEHHATEEQITEAMGLQDELRSKKLGDILVTKQVVSHEQLLEAIEQQHKMPLVRIGEALRSLGMVSDLQLKEALVQQQLDRSVPLGEVLVRMKVVSRNDLQIALARKMGYPLVNLEAFPVEPEALRKLNYAVASRLRVMPLLISGGRLVVALDDPSRRAALDEIEFNADMKVVPVLAHGHSIDVALHAAYDQIGSTANRKPEDLGTLKFDLTPPLTSTDQLVENLEKEGLDQGILEDENPIEQSDNSLVRLLNNMVIEAHKDGVSDIHIESYPGKEKIRVRFRKDGILRTYLELPPSYRSAIIARVKIMCDLDISERRRPQDGKINFSKFSPQHKIELRVATIPTTNGLEDVVLRLLASARPIPVDSLGLSEQNLKALLQAVERPYGMVLCVGPTGSGKTTTLHSALSHINVPERKIWTAEDPVEITQPGLRQVQVNPKIDWTFAKALRAFMRADPDVIMLGEIRDQETGHMAIEASLTGHLVLSTLHTNSAPETVTRLLDMGMDPFNFGDSLLAVLAQRLVRRMCQNCRSSRPASHDEVEELLGDYMNAFAGEAPLSRGDVLAGWAKRHAQDGRLLMHRSTGCDKCDQSGYKSRAGVHELMVVSRELRRLIQNGARAEALQAAAMKEGMRTLRQDGIEKVLAGQTTIEEVRATSNA